MKKHNSISWFIKIGGLVLLTLLILNLASVQTVHAATLTVNSTTDVIADDGQCTLREAITAANTDTASGVILGECIAGDVGADTITFDSSLNGTAITLSIVVAGEDDNATGDLDITDDLTIQGNGARNTIVDAADIDRVFHVRLGSAVTFNDLTIQNGDIAGDGGGLFNEGGTVDISRSTISSNNASGNGGGVYNLSGPMTIEASTINDNSAAAAGALLNVMDAVAHLLTITNSTFSNNSSSGGTIFDVSVFSNTAVNLGGNADAVLNHVTISNNNSGGGNIMASATLSGGASDIEINNTLLSGNTGEGCYAHNAGLFTLDDYNVFGTYLGDCTQGANDLVATGPGLASLANNGGPTDTHALVTGMNAIDISGMTGCASVDQRGVARPQGADCDAGAYELLNVVAPGVGGGDGPGGVGVTDGSSDLVLWLRSDRDVYSDAGCTTVAAIGEDIGCWQDQSGYGNHVAQAAAGTQPTLISNMANGFSGPNFDGDDYLATVTTGIVGSGNNYTKITISYETGGINGNILSSGTGGNHAQFKSSGMPTLWHNSTVLQSSLIIYNNFIIFSSTYNPTTPRAEILIDGSSHGVNYSPPSFTDMGSVLVGAYQENYFFQGHVPEAIIFDVDLTSVERILIENYLSAKYNEMLAANDVYDGDTDGNGDFDLDVAGIGQFGGNQHVQAHAAGMIVVDSSFLQDNGDWLLFGHRTTANSNVATDLPSSSGWGGLNQYRWDRHYYIDVTDVGTTGGTVDIIFDYSEGGMDNNPLLLPSGPVSNYRLLRRTLDTGDFTDITAVSGATVVISGDQVQFLGVDVAQLGSNFTLGTLDVVDSPTAVTLNSFTTNNQSLSLLAVLVVGVLTLGLAGLWLRRRTMR